MIVQTYDGLTTYTSGSKGATTISPVYDTRTSGTSLHGAMVTYGEVYRRQPNVRTVIDFLARNVAQLGVQVYRRVSDTDRVRLYDHPVAQWLTNPNPATTRYRLIESTMQDLGIYYSAFWLKVRAPGGRIGLVRMPPENVIVNGWLMPQAFQWTLPDGSRELLAPADVVYFTGYDPGDPVMGLSPLETLRRVLAEETAASEYRASYWANAARIEGVIERPKDAPKWTPDQKKSFRDQWQERFAGPMNAGGTAVLEDGMTFKNTSFSAKDSEYISARKLTREECAAAYHVPLPMVGILEHATFSNIKEQHKQLYQDCLAPWLEMIQEEIERQLLPEAKDTDNVYVEFNINEKLKGSFEEQAASLYVMVGRPIMTANEGRARLNLPAITDDPTADQLMHPLNMGAAGASSLLPDATGMTAEAAIAVRATTTVIERAWARQRARLAKVPLGERAAAFDVARWDRELAADLSSLAGHSPDADRSAEALARTVNADTLRLLAAGADAFSAAREAARYVE